MAQADIMATLLPTARVDVYAMEGSTAATAQKLLSDWRFARVKIGLHHEGIDAAIAHYAQAASPELVIIETNDIGENFVKQLGQLAGVCAAGTDAVVIGPTNDVHLYRSLVGMGVRDYLVRPVSDSDLVNVIAKVLIDKKGLTGARLIAVAGGKGGVGATTVTQVLAWIIADKLKQKTMLMDMAGSNSTLGVSFGIEPSTGFSEAVKIGVSGTEDDMRRILQQAGENLSILVCGGEPMLNVRPDPESVETLVSRIMQKYPVVVMDMSGASRAVQKRIVALASHLVVVTTPLLSALRNTRTYINEIKGAKGGLTEVDLVINMSGMAAGEEVSAQDIETALGLKPSAKIPYAPKIFIASETTGKPVGLNSAAEGIMQSLLTVAERATGVKQKAAAVADDTPVGLFDSIKKMLKDKQTR